MAINKFIYNYFLVLFAIIPISIIAGPFISLSNILIIDLSFICLIIYLKNYNFLKSKSFKYLVALYVYLIFNSFTSIDSSEGIYRNLGFIRIILLFVAINFFFNQNLFFKKVFWAWLIIISAVVLDIYLERISGKNFLGFGEQYGERIVSFFKDEPIVGGYVNSFYLIIIGFLFDNYKNYNQRKILLLSLIVIVAIFVTGERTNSIKAFLGISIFYFFLKDLTLKKKIIFLTTILIFISIIISNSNFLKLRYVDQIKYSKIENSLYYRHYKSGISVFKNNKFLGVGNKNYRIETCGNFDERKKLNNQNYLCSTHPHQTYFEFLSEHGIFGTIFLLFIFYKLIFSKIKETHIRGNYIQKGCLIYLTLLFLPLLPTGSFFNDYMITLFAINLSIFYGSNDKLNVFSIKKKYKYI